MQHLLNKCGQLSCARSAINTSTSNSMPGFYAPPGNLDCDTPLSQDSLDAARGFCGAAIAAVDVVLNKDQSGSGGGTSLALDAVQVPSFPAAHMYTWHTHTAHIHK